MRPTYRLKQVPATEPWLEILKDLDRETFRTDARFTFLESGWHFVATQAGTPVAFLTATPDPKTGVYIDRVGVRRDHRGHGLQIRLMRMCKRLAKRLGYKRLFSYTVNNPPSGINFCKLGFNVFKTEIYLRKRLVLWWELTI